EIRAALVVDQSKELRDPIGSGEQEFHCQLLTKRAGHVRGRLEDERVKAPLPVAGDAIQLTARLRRGEHVLDQTVGREPVEDTVDFSKVQVPEVAENALALAFQRVAVNPRLTLRDYPKNRVADAACMVRGSLLGPVALPP